MTTLAGRRHWIFDLDGTLTVAVHDFDALRDELELPRGAPILETLRGLPPDRAESLSRRVDQWEQRLSVSAEAARGAEPLLDALVRRGARLGLLTRNTRATADRTLESAGLDQFFAPDHRLGRGDATPKPSPDGIHSLLRDWGASSEDAVMVGDYLFDLQAGRAAGVVTVWIDKDGTDRFRGEADYVCGGLTELHELLDREPSSRVGPRAE